MGSLSKFKPQSFSGLLSPMCSNLHLLWLQNFPFSYTPLSTWIQTHRAPFPLWNIKVHLRKFVTHKFACENHGTNWRKPKNTDMYHIHVLHSHLMRRIDIVQASVSPKLISRLTQNASKYFCRSWWVDFLNKYLLSLFCCIRSNLGNGNFSVSCGISCCSAQTL